MPRFNLITISFFALLWSTTVMADIFENIEHHTADSDGVSIHYVATGPEHAPMVVMIHGFPDFWYTWKSQIEALQTDYRIVAIDLRGYNTSDKPEGVENYKLDLLTSDISAVITSTGRESATVVGHDWGGAIAWSLAMNHPERVENLIILNLPHPKGLSRELMNSEAQQQASGYAFFFQQPDSHNQMTAQQLVTISQTNADEQTKARYLEAFNKSSIESMINYYRANFPRPGEQFMDEYPAVSMPVLMFHGLADTALLPGALAGTWDWVSSTLTLVTIPGVGHWVQRDAAEVVNQNMLDWLKRRYPSS